MASLCALIVIVQAGCQARDLARAEARDTVAAYQSFLARYPRGVRAERARRLGERAAFRVARRADRPFEYRRYLARYRHGRYAKRCRTALARLGLSRARSIADYLLVVERHPHSPEAKNASARIADLRAEAAIASSNIKQVSSFLAHYLGHPKAAKVREHLAGLRFRNLTDEMVTLERYVDSFRGTRWAKRAEDRLRRLLVSELRQSPRPALLAALHARFPSFEKLAALEALVQQSTLRRALAEMDLATLRQTAGPQARAVRSMLKACDKDACAPLAALARRASPWRPPQALSTLSRRLYDADPLTSWHAMAALSFSPGIEGAALLVDRLGEPRLATVWAATRALAAWLGRDDPAGRQRWIKRQAQRGFRRANPDEVQRVAYLLGASGDLHRARKILEGLAQSATHRLSATYLLARTYGERAPRSLLTNLLALLRARVKWLESAFPSALPKDALIAASLAERELFAISEILTGLGPRAAAETSQLRQRVAGLLLGWRETIGRSHPGFAAATRVTLDRRAEDHELQRAPALKALGKKRGHLARAVMAAICLRDPPKKDAARDLCLKALERWRRHPSLTL